MIDNTKLDLLNGFLIERNFNLTEMKFKLACLSGALLIAGVGVVFADVLPQHSGQALTNIIGGHSLKNSAQYGDVISYEVNQVLSFPAFTVTYLGEETVGKGGTYSAGFVHHNFLVESTHADVQSYLMTKNRDDLFAPEEDKASVIGSEAYYEGFSRLSDKQKVSSTAGTGVTVETPFKVGGKTYYLDLAPRKNGKFVNSATASLIVHDEAEYNVYRKLID